MVPNRALAITATLAGPHDGKAKIDDELASSCLIEQGGKENKEEDKGRRNSYGYPEYGMGSQEHMVDKDPEGG